jgi:hypothetical protein
MAEVTEKSRRYIDAEPCTAQHGQALATLEIHVNYTSRAIPSCSQHLSELLRHCAEREERQER